MAFILHFANRLEDLARVLAKVTARALANPLEKEVIIVQSRGMERWVSMALARQTGVCANVWFPFPNAFLKDCFDRVLGTGQGEDPFERATAPWRIMNLLPDLCETNPAFSQIRHYLKSSPHPLKRYQLADKVADLFDQYILFRPEMVLKWEKNPGDIWQGILFHRLCEQGGGPHRARISMQFMDALKKMPDSADCLFPERICVFGISALPPFHLRVFQALSKKMEVNLFFMNPCREYWGDIASPREMRRLAAKLPGSDDPDLELHLEAGNPLLSSMGRLGRDFLDLVLDQNPYRIAEGFAEPTGENLLAMVQSDILNLKNRGAHQGVKTGVSAGDRSIQFHCCHGPMREVEVLLDRLLDLFDKDPDLLPGDVMVMAPDIQTYAPFVEAVFNHPEKNVPKIPFTIADQSMRRQSPVVDAVLEILDVLPTRFEASRVMRLLELPVIRTRFDLSEADLEPVLDWVQGAGIRWGMDADHRKAQGLAPFGDNTWQWGMSRMLLGYAMPGFGDRLFAGMAPYDEIEGQSALVMGRFLMFVHQLTEFAKAAQKPVPMDQWAGFFADLVDGFIARDETNLNDVRILKNISVMLAEIPARTGYVTDVDFAVFKAHVEKLLDIKGVGYGFFSGRVTFCSMLPMRSIPFKVICLLGMNSEAFPRASVPPGFDLMAQHPKKGDRSRRNDDRYLFLETLLSARSVFYVSFMGKSQADNSELTPSVLVSELADYLDQGFFPENGRQKDSMCDRLLTEHRLQAFSPANFDPDSGLFSYMNRQYQVALQLTGERKDPPDFFPKPLDAPEPSSDLDLEEVIRFFKNPAKYLLENRLGMFLGPSGQALEDTEVLLLDNRERYGLGMALLDRVLEGGAPEEQKSAIRARGKLPPKSVGQWAFCELEQKVKAFEKTIRSKIDLADRQKIQFAAKVGERTVRARPDHEFAGHLVLYRFAKIKANDLMRIWLEHLLACAGEEKPGPVSLYLGTDNILKINPLKDPVPVLARLLEIFDQGQTRPVRFFPQASHAFAKAFLKDGDSATALAAAQKQWEGNPYLDIAGEGADPYFSRCFENKDPFAEDFAKIALDVFSPLIGSLEA